MSNRRVIHMKRKISLGILFLLVLLVSSGSLGIYNLLKLSRHTKAIVRDNYETLYLCQQMRNLLDWPIAPNQEAQFNSALAMQQLNITEEEEGNLTARLRLNWIRYARLRTAGLLSDVRRDLAAIEKLNMQAIQRKNALAQTTADSSLLLISLISIAVVLITLVFLLRFPAYIAAPLQQLMLGIREITHKNYAHKIAIEGSHELKELADAFNAMAEQLNEFEKTNLSQLMYQKARAEAVINSLADASIGFDNEGKILFANSEALKILQLNQEAIVGKTAAQITGHHSFFKLIISSPAGPPFKAEINDKDVFFVKEKRNILKDGRQLGELLSIRNVTTFREKDIAKTNFLATISHELKTPLSSADIALKLLSNEKIGSLNAEQKQIVSDLSGANHRLIRLVSELLDLSQAETGNINLNISSVRLTDVVRYALEALKTQLIEKNLRVECRYSEPDLGIKADPEKAAWVLINVLVNAIRYSPAHSVITLKSQCEQGYVLLTVKDNGPGIPAGFEQNLFRRFYKAPGKDNPGTGLGLSIAKEFMEAMQGSIGLESSNSQGAAFTLRFVATAVPAGQTP